MSKAFDDIKAEREYQVTKWGTAFDDQNTPHQWAGYIGHYNFRNLAGNPADVSMAQRRIDAVKVAALAVAEIEAIDRKMSPVSVLTTSASLG